MSITSERIRENCFIHHLMDAAADDIEALEQELATITKQRDLAVEAMKMAVEMIETNAHERRHVRWKLNDALSAIKESEEN